jgi:pimeloyl-ACP methyl ester carboxylesterase
MPLLDINGIEVNFESVGSGHPVVLLHGWGTSGRVWDAQRTEFSSEYRIVTVDWRGCGGTSAVDTGNTIDQIAEDLHDVIVKLGLDKPIVVGWSMGGTFAVELGVRWPELVGGVVTVDAVYHGGVVEDPEPVRGLVRALRAARIPTLKAMVSEWFEPAVGESGYYDWAYAEVLRSSPFIDTLYLDHLSYDPRPGLARMQVPVRLMHGELDVVIPRRYPLEAAEILGQEVDILQGCGHFPHHLQPEVFNPVLRSTLRSLTAQL